MAAPTSDTDQSYTQMDQHDLESIGAHCAFCRQKDFLPFRCESCHKKFCLDHRTETSHYCENKGAYLEARRKQNAKGVAGPARPSLLTHEAQCSDPKCKTLIDTPLVMGIGCDKCNRRYCSKHRLPEEHNCRNLTPIGARAGGNAFRSGKEESIAVFKKLGLWGAKQKEEIIVSVKGAMPAPKPGSKLSAKARDTAIKTYQSQLKQGAKGEAKIAMEKRLYVQILGVSDAAPSTPAKWPIAKVFYTGDWTAGRVLDLAAKELKIANNNNRSVDEDQKLKVFHVDLSGGKGKVLDTGKSLAAQGVQTGDGLLLYKKWESLPATGELMEKFGFSKWVQVN